MTESNTSQIENYARLISDSASVDTNLLVNCLDDILSVLADYLKIIDKVSCLEQITAAEQCINKKMFLI